MSVTEIIFGDMRVQVSEKFSRSFELGVTRECAEVLRRVNSISAHYERHNIRKADRYLKIAGSGEMLMWWEKTWMVANRVVPVDLGELRLVWSAPE